MEARMTGETGMTGQVKLADKAALDTAKAGLTSGGETRMLPAGRRSWHRR